MRVSTSIVLGAAVAALSTAACGGGQEEPQTAAYQQGQPYGQQPAGYPQQQQQPGAYPQQQQQPGAYPQQQQPGAYPQQQPQPQPTTGQPAPQPAAAGGQAAPMDATAASAAQPILNMLAQSQAPAGAQPVGSPLVGNFQAGQKLENQLQLQPGKCYTVVAAGLPPITEVDVKFTAVSVIPGSALVLAQDNDTGNQAVLGEKPNCHKNALPVAVPVTVVLEVTAGQGIAAAQVYEK